MIPTSQPRWSTYIRPAERRSSPEHQGAGLSRRPGRVKRSLALRSGSKRRRWLGGYRLSPPDGIPDRRRHRGRAGVGRRLRRLRSGSRRSRWSRSLLRRLGLGVLRNLTSAGVDLGRASAEAAAQLDQLRRRLLPTEPPPSSAATSSRGPTVRWRRPPTRPALRGSTEMAVRVAVTGDYVYDYYQWQYEYFHEPKKSTERPETSSTAATTTTEQPTPGSTLSPNSTVMLQR